MKSIHRHGVLTIFLSMCAPLGAQSTYVAGTGNWSTAASWSPAGVPAAGANIILSNASAGGGTLTLDGTTSRTIGSYTHGDLGTRTGEFTLQTGTNTLTMSGGLVANGAFTGVGLRLRGNPVVSANQTWSVGGSAGSATADAGVVVQERSTGNRGTLTLNGTLTKVGPGQLMFAGTTLDGAGDLVVNEGSLKLNAGSSLELRATGTGKFVLNNASALYFSKNSGTFGDSVTFNRAFQFNGTASVTTSGNATTSPWTIASNMEWNGAHTLTVNNSVGTGTPNLNYQFSGIMSGSGSITKLGPSQLYLAGSGSNTLSGLVTVSAGELRLAKTSATAVAGDILITGGALRMDAPHQIADSSNITVTGGAFIDTAGHADTIASLSINSAAVTSVSGIIVTGATTIAGGTHDVNSGFTFTTHSLAISNNAALRCVANGGPGTIAVGAGGLRLDNGSVLFGGAGGAYPILLNLAGDVASTGNSQFSPPNFNDARAIDLQGGSRAFVVGDGLLDVRTTVQNGTLVKSGTGTLRLSRAGSTAHMEFASGPVEIIGQVNAGNLLLSGASVRMDVGGATPAKIQTSGSFTATGGSIEIFALNGPVTPGVMELVRYGGALVGQPVVNIPPQLAASRMNPVIDYGAGNNSAITLTSTGNPLTLTWDGAGGGRWDNRVSAGFNGGTEPFYALDSVVFNDTSAVSNIALDETVYPTEVTFSHGTIVPSYALTGSGGIAGPAKLVKSGLGTTILATNNTHTGGTEVREGMLQVGNGGMTGTLGSGQVTLDFGAVLRFARDGQLGVGNVISGGGSIRNSGPGTVAFTGNSTGFYGDIGITAGTLQLGDGGANGSLGSAAIDISAGGMLAVKLTGVPTIANWISGDGAVTVIGGSPILSNSNSYTGGITLTEGGIVRLPSDAGLGAVPLQATGNAVRLVQGGLKNQDSDPVIDANRGISISGEAYFTAGWAKTLTIAGPIRGTGNVFINYDSGRVLFSNESSDWTGVLTLGAAKPGASGTTGGILEINAINSSGTAGPLGKASADPANWIFNGGRLNYTGPDAGTDRGFTLEGAGTIEVTNARLTHTGRITGPGAFTKAGSGTLVLTETNDFLGIKTLAGGTVILKSPFGLGDVTSPVRFTGTTGVLDLAMDASVAPYPVDIGVNNTGTILSGVATPGAAGFTHVMGNLSLSTVSLTVAASGEVVGGDPRVRFADLNLSGGSAGTTTLNPTTAGITLGSASIGANNYAKTLSLGGTHQDNQITGPITDGINVLSLRKDNDSVWTVSGDNAFTGNVTVDDGVLVITHANALGSPAKTWVISGDAATNRLPELRLTGGISPRVNVLNISGAGIASTGALRNLSGNNTVHVTTQMNMTSGNGGTTLYSDSGTLTLNTPLLTSTNTNRALTLAGPGNGVINAVIANGSTTHLPVTKTGTGTWTLNGAHTYSGTTTVSEGVLSLGQAALNDGAAVNIAAGAVLHLNFKGADRVGSLTIDGVTKPDGLYNASTDPGVITGTGSIRVGPEPLGYATWAASHPFTAGVNDGPGDDPDGDHIPNLLEYVLGGIPVGSGAADGSILPKQTLTPTDLVLTFKRSSLSESDVILKVQWSDNLVTWNDFAVIGAGDALPAVDITDDTPTAGFDTVVVSLPRSSTAGGRIFARVQAVK